MLGKRHLVADCLLIDQHSLDACQELFKSRCTSACKGRTHHLPLHDRSRYGMPSSNFANLWRFLTDILSPPIRDQSLILDLFARTSVSPVPAASPVPAISPVSAASAVPAAASPAISPVAYQNSDVWKSLGSSAYSQIWTFWISIALLTFLGGLSLLAIAVLFIPHRVSLPVLSVTKYSHRTVVVWFTFLGLSLTAATVGCHLYLHYAQADVFGFACTSMQSLYDLLYTPQPLENGVSFNGLQNLYVRIEEWVNFSQQLVQRLGESEHVYGSTVPLLDGLFAPITWTTELVSQTDFTGWDDRLGRTPTFSLGLIPRHSQELQTALLSSNTSQSFGDFYARVRSFIPEVPLPIDALKDVQQSFLDVKETLRLPVNYIDQMTHILPTGGELPYYFNALIRHQIIATVALGFLFAIACVWTHLRRRRVLSVDRVLLKCGARGRSVLGLICYILLMLITSGVWMVSTAMWFGLTHFASGLCSAWHEGEASTYVLHEMGLGDCIDHGRLFSQTAIETLAKFDFERAQEVHSAISQVGWSRDTPLHFDALIHALDTLDGIGEIEPMLHVDEFLHASKEAVQASPSPAGLRALSVVLQSQLNASTYEYQLCVGASTSCPLGAKNVVIVDPNSVWNHWPNGAGCESHTKDIWALELGRDDRIREAFNHLLEPTEYRRFAEDLYLAAWRASVIDAWQREASRGGRVFFDVCAVGWSCNLFYSESLELVSYTMWRSTTARSLRGLTDLYSHVGNVTDALMSVSNRTGLFYPLVESLESLSSEFSCDFVHKLISDIRGEVCYGLAADAAAISWSGLLICLLQGSLTFVSISILRNRMSSPCTATTLIVDGLFDYEEEE